MKYLKEVTDYCFKNFWFVMLFSVVPAIFVGLLLKPFQFIEFLFSYPSISVQDFGGFQDFFYKIIPFDWLTILLSVVGIVLCAVLLSMLLGGIERHFRTGKKTYELSKNDFNNNFLSVLFAILFLLIFIFVAQLVVTLLLTLFHFLFAKHGVLILSVVFAYVVGVLFFAFVAFLSVLFGIAAADKMLMGSPFGVALGTALNALKKNSFQIFLTSIVPFLIAIVLSVLGKLAGIVWLSNILSVLILIPFLCVLVMIVFFENYDLKRYDTRPYYSLK